MRKGFVFVLRGSELPQQMADGIVARSVRCPAIEPRGFVFHFLGEFARRLDAQRPIEPNRPPRHKSLDVLSADQRQEFAEFSAV